MGRPGAIYPPERAPPVHEQLGRLSFGRYVFGVDTDGKSRAEIMDEIMAKYARALGSHRQDRLLSEE